MSPTTPATWAAPPCGSAGPRERTGRSAWTSGGHPDTGTFALSWGAPHHHRSDVLVRTPTRRYLGNDIYNTTGTGQTATATVGTGATVEFDFELQNDSDGADPFRVRATPSDSRFRVTYRLPDGTDMTGPLTAGITTETFAPHQSVSVIASVRARTGTARGAQFTLRMKMTNVIGARFTDAAFARITRT